MEEKKVNWLVFLIVVFFFAYSGKKFISQEYWEIISSIIFFRLIFTFLIQNEPNIPPINWKNSNFWLPFIIFFAALGVLTNVPIWSFFIINIVFGFFEYWIIYKK